MTPSRRCRGVGARGFTLLELLVVVVILAALATAAIGVMDQTDAQSRFDDTRSRAQQARDGIVGPNRSLNGSPELSGFVADMGRLPASLSELLAQGSLSSYTENFGGANIGTGWRGPYVRADQDGTFRDGWANPGPAPDYGWVVSTAGAPFPIFSLTSLGSDGLANGTPGSGTTWDALDQNITIAPDDYLVRVSTWSIDVVFSNAGATPFNQSIRVRLYHPTSGADVTFASVWPTTPAARDAAPFLTLPVSVSVAPGATTRVTFNFFDPVSSADKRVPIGVRSLGAVDAGTGAAVGSQLPVQVTLVPRANLPLLTGPTGSPVTWTVP